MNLTAADVPSLPLPIALVDSAGEVLAASPEWAGDGPGSAVFRVGDVSLVVGDDEPDPDIATATQRLLDELRAAAAGSSGTASRRLRMLTTALSLVAGHLDDEPASTADVVDDLAASLELYSNFPVDVVSHEPGAVPNAGAVAWALHQLVRNARAHDDATTVALHIEPGPSFTLEWPGTPVAGGIGSGRHQADRDRWGLGYVLLAADALGAVFLAPFRSGPGRLEAVFALDRTPRLRLPLAAIDARGQIERSSQGWEAENLSPDGRTLPRRVLDVVEDAQRHPGSIARAGTLRGRATDRRTWVALPPEAVRDRARDVVRGLRHGPEMLEIPQPQRTSVRALTHIIETMLGDPLPRSSSAWFDEHHPDACAALGVAPLGVPYPGPVAPDPCVAAYLTAAFGTPLRVSDQHASVVVPVHRRLDPVARRLADEAGVITLA